MPQTTRKAVAFCCPRCGSHRIAVAMESVIADSYYCPNCRMYFSVTAAFQPPRTWTTSTTNAP